MFGRISCHRAQTGFSLSKKPSNLKLVYIGSESRSKNGGGKVGSGDITNAL